jgi:DNA repair exonuclease SbcCD ATPase subunit
MQILELTLHNYKVHRNKTVKFENGVVGIIGDNGSGKSSIISAICFLFTGEVDTDKKSECVTLGETEGWVKGKFILNDKEGSLERHLASSTVVLVYDGVTYKKVSEVNKLWNELLQIDTTIFNNVIVAKQGEIQSLFSNESAVREKVFQKIFMVPPTEKIRNTIWDHYIKTCPPERLEEDVQLLYTNQASVASERNNALKEIEIKTSELADEALLNSIIDRIRFIERCAADVSKRPALEKAVTDYTAEQTNNNTEITNITDCLSKLPKLHEAQAEKNRLIVAKTIYDRKQSLVVEIDSLSASIDEAEISNKRAQLVDSEATKQKHTDILSGLNAKLRDTISQKTHLLALKGHANCPTCRQQIPNTSEFLNELMKQEVQLTAEIGAANRLHQTASKTTQLLNTEITKSQAAVQRLAYLREELAKLSDVGYSKDRLDQINHLIDTIAELTSALQSYNNRQVKLSADLRIASNNLSNLATYDGEGDMSEELEVLNAAKMIDKTNRDALNVLNLQAAKLEHELSLLEQRITTSRANQVYNNRRKSYLDRLDKVHGIFNVSKFPRRLIETYMDHVQVALASYLAYFNLPYNVVVSDGFKIGLCDEANRPLPSVSGGQEMMVGICLRLALHKMFAKAFPIWIIDEGTTHLSESKKEHYFDLIDELRRQKVISQIIIIDHDVRLGKVVDQTIEL